MNNVPDPLMALNSQFSIVTLDDFCAEIVDDPPPLETVCACIRWVCIIICLKNIL